MISEICSFIDTIQEEYYTKNIELKNGLYIYILFSKDKGPINSIYKSFLINEEQEESKRLIEEFDPAIYKKLFYTYIIDFNKRYAKSISSCSPFVLNFSDELLNDSKFNEKKESPFIVYFNSIKKNYSLKGRYPFNNNRIIDLIRDFCLEKLFNLIKSDKNYKKAKKKEIKNDRTKNLKIIVFFYPDDLHDCGNCIDDYIMEDFYLFLENRGFGTNTYNIEVKGKKFGLSNFFNIDNKNKKYFVQHRTTNFIVNNRISEEFVAKLYKFELLLYHKKLPNPLPVFVSENFLNKEIVRLYNDEKVLSYNEIIKRLYKSYKKDLFDYYIIFWGDNIIYDMDYVKRFKYNLDGNWVIKNIMGIEEETDIILTNVFDLETKVANVIFEIDDKESIISVYYSKNKNKTFFIYGKNFIDYIYKSQEEAITKTSFYNLMMDSILENVFNSKNIQTKQILKKLNIFFSLNQIFDKDNSNFRGVDMTSELPKYQENIRRLINGDTSVTFRDDCEFAFAAGQLIYYILSKNELSNKTLALLTPYINKTNPKQFIMAIANGINKYKHKFNWIGDGKNRFERLAAKVLTYKCESNIRDLLPFILAGYFSDSLLYEKN